MAKKIDGDTLFGSISPFILQVNWHILNLSLIHINIICFLSKKVTLFVTLLQDNRCTDSNLNVFEPFVCILFLNVHSSKHSNFGRASLIQILSLLIFQKILLLLIFLTFFCNTTCFVGTFRSQCNYYDFGFESSIFCCPTFGASSISFGFKFSI